MWGKAMDEVITRLINIYCYRYIYTYIGYVLTPIHNRWLLWCLLEFGPNRCFLITKHRPWKLSLYRNWIYCSWKRRLQNRLRKSADCYFLRRELWYQKSTGSLKFSVLYHSDSKHSNEKALDTVKCLHFRKDLYLQNRGSVTTRWSTRLSSTREPRLAPGQENCIRERPAETTTPLGLTIFPRPMPNMNPQNGDPVSHELRTTHVAILWPLSTPG